MEDTEGAVHHPEAKSSHYEKEFREAAYLLAMWSILVMNEGVIRFIQHGQPAAEGLFTGMPIRFWSPMLGGLFEVVFGVFGFAVGLAGGVLGYFNRTLTLALVVVQNILGWYVFINYVFIIPAVQISMRPPYGALSLAATKVVGTMGILSSVAFCLALQGGQFVFICRMLAFGGESDFLNQRNGAKMRAVFWNVNYALAGLWATIQAAVIINGMGAGLTKMPFMAPPNVGRIPLYLLFTGLIMLVWALAGVGISIVGQKSLIKNYIIASFPVFLFVFVHYTIGQLGFISGNPAPPPAPAAGAAMHNHLVMMVCFLGPYFMWKQTQDEEN